MNNCLLASAIKYLKYGEKLSSFLEAAKGRNIIWNIKKEGTVYSLEFYFENRKQKNGVVKSFKLLKRFFDVNINSQRIACVPCELLSFEVSPALFQGKAIDSVCFYCRDDAKTTVSYRVTAQTIQLENIYYTYQNPAADLKRIVARLKSSLFVDVKNVDSLNLFSPRWLKSCREVCVAYKKDREAIYFQGISKQKFVFFLQQFDSRGLILKAAKDYKNHPERQDFSIFFDYMMKDGVLTIVKSGFIGRL